MKSASLIVLFVSLAMAMEGKRCKCSDTTVSQDLAWTRNECTKLQKVMKWCYGQAEEYCETGDEGSAFDEDCTNRSGDSCYADDC
jgi:hypothetical protein